MQFLGSNIFLRYVLNDEPIKARACKQLFIDIAQTKVKAWTSDLVVAEVVFVLSNKDLQF